MDRRRLAGLLAATLMSLPAGLLAAPALPQHLRDTGLHADDVLSFSPQYPLWSDGADKRRWFRLPRGQRIDASQPDAWRFPPGTQLWKEFAYDGRPVETRYIERLPDGSWRYAAYLWNEDGSDAVLAPERGIAALPVRAAPGGRYTIPARTDCIACHGSTAVPVLGLSALQLSPDRDPLAAGAAPRRDADLDLRGLVERGALRGLPAALLAQPPRIPAATPVERAALGYLHGNCAHCHNTSGAQAPVDLTLAQRSVGSSAGLHDVLRSAVEAAGRYRPRGAAPGAQVIVPGDAEASVLALRMRSRDPQVQMPPLGTRFPDPEGLALVSRWINEDLPRRHKEAQP